MGFLLYFNFEESYKYFKINKNFIILKMDKLFDLFNFYSSTNKQPEIYHVKLFNSPFKNAYF